jgi:hypothetical protein
VKITICFQQVIACSTFPSRRERVWTTSPSRRWSDAEEMGLAATVLAMSTSWMQRRRFLCHGCPSSPYVTTVLRMRRRRLLDHGHLLPPYGEPIGKGMGGERKEEAGGLRLTGKSCVRAHPTGKGGRRRRTEADGIRRRQAILRAAGYAQGVTHDSEEAYCLAPSLCPKGACRRWGLRPTVPAAHVRNWSTVDAVSCW